MAEVISTSYLDRNFKQKCIIMRKILLTAILFCFAVLGANAQKYALVDMEYILKNIPAYERANEQLNQISKKWQGEVEAVALEAQTLYKNYQSEAVFLSEEQKIKKELIRLTA